MSAVLQSHERVLLLAMMQQATRRSYSVLTTNMVYALPSVKISISEGSLVAKQKGQLCCNDVAGGLQSSSRSNISSRSNSNSRRPATGMIPPPGALPTASCATSAGIIPIGLSHRGLVLKSGKRGLLTSSPSPSDTSLASSSHSEMQRAPVKCGVVSPRLAVPDHIPKTPYFSTGAVPPRNSDVSGR